MSSSPVASSVNSRTAGPHWTSVPFTPAGATNSMEGPPAGSGGAKDMARAAPISRSTRSSARAVRVSRSMIETPEP